MMHGRFIKRIWLIPVLILALAVTHGFALYRISSHVVWTVALGLAVLVLLAHLGVLTSTYAIFRRRPRHKL
jgi:hypothetical protein